MESNGMTEAKYQKLASEYSKLRAQAIVLKKAVLEEQAKNSNVRDQLRQRETAVRRFEQEIDSLDFRNKQLEHRVEILQDEVAKHEGRKKERDPSKRGNTSKTGNPQGKHGADDSVVGQDALIFEELQKKIMENAHLTSLIDDRERDLQIHSDRILSLEQSLEKRSTEQNDLEKRLRREIETLQHRNSELETKLVEAASLLGSEDALSVSGSDSTPLHNIHHMPTMGSSASASSDERIALLEKEIIHWRTQYEISKLNQTFGGNQLQTSTSSSSSNSNLLQQSDLSCSTSTTAAGLSIKPSYAESKSAQRESLKEPPPPPSHEQMIYDNFSKKFEDLLKAKCLAESRVSSYETEALHLQNCLENATFELKTKDEQVQSISQAMQMVEEDLATTRINYEEQISVLTEQVISLSEQLAACK